VGEFDLIERLSPFLSGAGDQVLVGAVKSIAAGTQVQIK